jgi:hypothetical protein
MIPKNSPERRKAFYTFLIFLLASTAIIFITAFMSTRMPDMQVKQLQEEKALSDREKDFSQRFTTGMFEVTTALDSIDNMVTPESLDPQISAKIGELVRVIETDSIQNKALYRSIAATLSTLHAIKIEKRTLVRTGKSSTQQTNSNVAQLELEKNAAISANDQIQRLVNVWGSKLDPAFVQEVKKYTAK